MARRSDHSREELHRMALKAARTIVAQRGLRGLSTRRIARKMGYSPGTLYQLFDDLDELILRLNTETLEALFEACRDIPFDAEPETILQELAQRYISFVSEHSRLWSALFEHRLPAGRETPAWYEERVRKLLGLAEKALLSLFPEEEERRVHEAQVLWAGLYGIASLASAQKLARTEAPHRMVRSLVTNYLAGLRSTRRVGADTSGAFVKKRK
jgi:AcrR family transcriptional regulator